jgi:uncharacterized protein YodC (DUF2158 family)
MSESSNEFGCGDVVVLKSGGPPMTIESIETREVIVDDDDGKETQQWDYAKCVWFDLGSDDRWGEPLRAEFDVDTLEPCQFGEPATEPTPEPESAAG